MYTKCLASARLCVRCWGYTREQDKVPALEVYILVGWGWGGGSPINKVNIDDVKALIKKKQIISRVVEVAPLNRMV